MSAAKTDARVLFLTENYPPSRGGMAESCDRIVHGLQKAGVTIDLVHFSRKATRPVVETKRRGRHIVWPVPADGDPAHALNTLWNLLDRPGVSRPLSQPSPGTPPLPWPCASPAPTHVLSFGGTLPLLAGPVYAAWLGVPLVTLLRGNDFDAGVFTERRREVLREAVHGAARVCVVCSDHAAKIAALYPNVQPVCVRNGIDLERWVPLPSDRERAAAFRRDHVGPGRRVLGIFGHIKRKKGGLFFLQGLLASGLFHRFHLLFVGELEDDVGSFLEQHTDDLSFTRHPFTDRYELLGHYLSCDLQVIPSYYDGLPNVLLEAAGLGLPLLCSTAGGMGDLLADGEHGFLFHPGDEAGLQAALHRAAAATDKDLQRLSASCRALCQTYLTPEAETRGYLAVLRESAGRR